MFEDNAVTDFLTLAGGAAFFAIGFVITLRDAMGLANPSRPLIDRTTRHVYGSRGARAAWVSFASVLAAAAIYATFRFATDPGEMPSINRALFWLVFAFQVAWLLRALYRRFRRAD